MELNKLSDYERAYPHPRKVTLCYLVDKDGMVLIAMKKRGFGVGKWNGVGGKLAEGESVEDALLRETREEIAVDLKSFRKTGIIRFYFGGKDNDKFNQEVHVFVADSWEGEPKESEEMKPKWFRIGDIPLDSMWSDDKYWLPDALRGNYITASFLFDEDGNVKESDINARPEAN